MKTNRLALIISSGVTLLSAVLAWQVHARKIQRQAAIAKSPIVAPASAAAAHQPSRPANASVAPTQQTEVSKPNRRSPPSRTLQAENLAIHSRRETPEGVRGDDAKRRHDLIISYGPFTRQYLADANLRDRFWDVLSAGGSSEEVGEVIGEELLEKFLEFRNLRAIRATLRDFEAAFSAAADGDTNAIMTQLALLLNATPEAIEIIRGQSVPYPEQFMSKAGALLSVDQMKLLMETQERRRALQEAYRRAGLRP